MAATHFQIVLFKFKNGEVIGEGQILVNASADPGVDDVIMDLANSICPPIFKQLIGVLTLGLWTGLLSSLSIIPGLGVVTGAIITEGYAKQVKKDTENFSAAFQDVITGGNWLCHDSQEVLLKESDEFDSIDVQFRMWGDDAFFCARALTLPSQVNNSATTRVGKNAYQYDHFINTADFLEGGVYPFIFGGRDDGSYFDVVGLCTLILRWEKKTKPLCASLRSINEHIDPINPLRSLREVADILDQGSLRGCVEELAGCRSIQASPLRLYWQNTALLAPELLPGEILGIPVSAKKLYIGKDRHASLNAFINYLKMEQPDIAGFGEVWLQEERDYLRDNLKDIYYYDTLDPDLCCLQGPMGSAPSPYLTMLDNGGLMLFSKYPIVASSQHIFTSAFGEDAFSAKGVLHGAVCVPGFPSLMHIFLTHLQSCTTDMEEISLPGTKILANPGSGNNCEEKKEIWQVEELKNFILSTAGSGPCILMGDFNINGFDENKRTDLTSRLGGMVDCWLEGKENADAGVEAYWPGCSASIPVSNSNFGKTKGGPISFKSDEPDLKYDFPGRQEGGERIDYVITWPNPGFNGGTHVQFGRRRVVQVMLNDVQDASDHYGLRIDVKSIRVREIL